MPKGKRRSGGKKGSKPDGLRLPNDREDTDHSADNCSVVSNISDATSIYDDIGVQTAIAEQQDGDDTTTVAFDDFEEKVKDCIDGCTQKSAGGRQNCLKGLVTAFSKRYVFDFLLDRYVTITDSLERCLKKGKGEEQVLAAKCAMSLVIQLGPGAEGNEVYRSIKPIMQTVMLDRSASSKARAACAEGMAVCCFIAGGDLEEVVTMLSTLETIFSASYLKGDKSPPTVTPEMTQLHFAALNGWSLLLSISPPSAVDTLLYSHLPKLPQLLESADVDLRIAAGEAIALMYELAREQDEEFEGDDIDNLCTILKRLATDSNKYRAKKDRRQQRSSFRDILKTIEIGESPELSIKFGPEVLIIDSWVRKRQYDMMCNCIGAGINVHLQENELVRDIFELGAPIPVGTAKPIKSSKHERHQYNLACFKARTKAMSKVRDKRMVQASY
ncbi:interferon-related developmental regulator 2-like isoform X2 [Lineus longissimus]|uniref:interferon-related developmental regulator 2-like isoform X2 n=1 Tax=Lineus longissimus TaxID=88925 RepID=UPI002B4C2C10